MLYYTNSGRAYSTEIGRRRYVKLLYTYSYCKIMVMKAVAIYQKMGATAFFLQKNEHTNRNQKEKSKSWHTDPDYACSNNCDGGSMYVCRLV